MNKSRTEASKESMEDRRNVSTMSDESGNTETDAELVARSQQGQMDAFDELVTRYRGKIYAMIVNMIRSEADAWDLAQETFVRAWKALGKFESRANFYTWIYRIAHNVTYDWIRKKKIVSEGEFDDANPAQNIEPGSKTTPKQASSPDDKLQSSELGDKIREAISQLSEDHRAVFLLKEVDGRQYNEIAEITGCSIGTVMSRLFYARKKLQTLLKDTYDTI